MLRVLCADASVPELQHFSLYAFMLPHTVHYHYVGFNSKVFLWNNTVTLELFKNF